MNRKILNFLAKWIFSRGINFNRVFMVYLWNLIDNTFYKTFKETQIQQQQKRETSWEKNVGYDTQKLFFSLLLSKRFAHNPHYVMQRTVLNTAHANNTKTAKNQTSSS